VSLPIEVIIAVRIAKRLERPMIEQDTIFGSGRSRRWTTPRARPPLAPDPNYTCATAQGASFVPLFDTNCYRREGPRQD